MGELALGAMEPTEDREGINDAQIRALVLNLHGALSLSGKVSSSSYGVGKPRIIQICKSHGDERIMEHQRVMRGIWRRNGGGNRESLIHVPQKEVRNSSKGP